VTKLGPILAWGIYLLGCQWAAPEALPFIVWAIVVCGLLLIVYQVWSTNELLGPKHHDVLYNKSCRGWVVETSRRKMDNKVEITKMCEVCKTMFFEVQEDPSAQREQG
jgi:ribosomal protein L33